MLSFRTGDDNRAASVRNVCSRNDAVLSSASQTAILAIRGKIHDLSFIQKYNALAHVLLSTNTMNSKALFFYLFLLLPFLGWNQTSGTITVRKKKATLNGLYERTMLLDNNATQKVETSRNAEHFYFYFFPNGRLYQIQSNEKSVTIESLVKNNPAKLRPILAQYQIIDSIVLIKPISGGIGEGVEPSKAYYEGIFKDTQLLISDPLRQSTSIFEPRTATPEN